MRPCSKEFHPVCGSKKLEGGESIDKMFPNVCKMEEENDCVESGSHPWISKEHCPSQGAMDEERLRAEFQEENEEDEESFRKFLRDLKTS